MVPLGRDDPGRWRRRLPTLTGRQRRFESSLAGEVLISVFVAIVILVNVVWNLPRSEIERRAKPVLLPIASVTAASQSWAMYAPNPIQRLEMVTVRVTMSDGSTRVWTPTGDSRATTALVWYHWQKLKETVVRDKDIRAGVARWAVRELTRPDEHPVRVEMILDTENLPSPGDAGRPQRATETLYSESLAGQP